MDDLVQRLRELAARKWPDAGNREASLFGRAADEIERLRTELAEVYGNDSARDAVAMLRNAVAKGFQFALCVEAEKSTACLHNTDDGKVCARMLERFARQQSGAEAT
jgi:hypothetical protein